MSDVVLIEGNCSVFYQNNPCFCPVLPCRFLSIEPFLQKKNIGGDFCSGIALECSVWQSHCCNEIGFFSECSADGAILFIHRVAAGDKSHKSAWTDFLQRFREKVVVNGTGEAMFHCRIVNRI